MHSSEKIEDGCEARGQMTVNMLQAEGMEYIFFLFYLCVTFEFAKHQ